MGWMYGDFPPSPHIEYNRHAYVRASKCMESTMMSDPNLWMNEFRQREKRVQREVSGDRLARGLPKDREASRDFWATVREALGVFRAGKTQHALADTDLSGTDAVDPVPAADLLAPAEDARELVGRAGASKP